MKKNNLLEKIPLEPAEMKELKQDINEDLNNCLRGFKKGDVPICHVLSKLYQEEASFKALIDNYTDMYY
jgi:hypothetical protein